MPVIFFAANKLWPSWASVGNVMENYMYVLTKNSTWVEIQGLIYGGGQWSVVNGQPPSILEKLIAQALTLLLYFK